MVEYIHFLVCYAMLSRSLWSPHSALGQLARARARGTHSPNQHSELRYEAIWTAVRSSAAMGSAGGTSVRWFQSLAKMLSRASLSSIPSIEIGLRTSIHDTLD